MKVASEILKKRLKDLIFELGLLCSMLITLIIPSVSTSIASWTEISPLLFIRASIWLAGLSLLPGFYILRLTTVGKNLSELGKIIVGINLSFVLLGLASIVLYYLQESISLLPWFLLAFLFVLAFLNWKKFSVNPLMKKLKISRWNLLLATAVIATISLSFYFQLGQRYLLPGDVWVSLKPAVEIISQRNVYQTFKTYPLMFGHILATLSICSGLPIVNTYAILFPLAVLNLLSFFIFAKTVFKLNDKVATLASIIYGFGAGLGLLIEFLGYGGTLGFWSLSRLTNDLSLPNTYTLLFYHKPLALTQAFTSVVCLMIATKLEKTTSKIVAIMISALLLLFSFYIHMLEAMIFIPMIFLVVYLYGEKWRRFVFVFYILISLLILSIMDLFMEGFYFWLIFHKISGVIDIIGIEKVLTYSLLLLGGGFLAFIVMFFFSDKLAKSRVCKDHLGMIKAVLVSALLIVYVCGLWFWETPSPPGSFPWYRYVTRYGFIGVLALIGVAESKWREKWFLTVSFWSLYIILLGRMWWESRISGYLTPIVVIFASIGTFEILKKAYTSIYLKVTTTKNTIEKTLTLNLKQITTVLIISILILSTTSTIYGAIHYFSSPRPCVSDDTARAFAWINQNVPESNTVLVPKIYNIYKGVETIGDREIYLCDMLPVALDVNLIETLDNYNIRYAVTVDEDEPSPVLRVLLSHSTPVFQSGDVKVFKLPDFQSPSSKEYSVAVVDKQLLGFSGNHHDLGWIDDSFKEGWTYKMVNASSNGEVLTFEWQLHKLYEPEPYATRTIPPIDTNRYPYLIIKYRNTIESVPVTQIITLINETGYPKGFIKNFYLPLSKEDTFEIFMAKLPENQAVAEIWVWMRNWENLNGTAVLQVDYIGFTSLETAFDPELNMRFLSMALPALWPANYSIFSSFDRIGNAPIVVSTYDKNVLNYIENATHTNTFVFLNHTAVFPPWGTDWRNVKPGIISGYMEDKKVIILGVASLQGDISDLAESIYEEIRE